MDFAAMFVCCATDDESAAMPANHEEGSEEAAMVATSESLLIDAKGVSSKEVDEVAEATIPSRGFEIIVQGDDGFGLEYFDETDLAYLLVSKVVPGLVVDKWNKSQTDVMNIVHPKDRIFSVDGTKGSAQELRTKLAEEDGRKAVRLVFEKPRTFRYKIVLESEEEVLGLDIVKAAPGLVVCNVKNGGAVSKFNEGSTREKRITPGDIISEINGKMEQEDMLLQIRDKRELTLIINSWSGC